MSLPEITKEQREMYLEQARETKRLAEEYARANLRNDFPDINHWRRLASHYGIRLPLWYDRSTKAIRRALTKLGFTGEWVPEVTGFSSLKELMDANPSWPSYAFVGLVLESAHERDGFVEMASEHFSATPGESR